MEPTSKEWNKVPALSFREKGKRCSLVASWFTLWVTLSLRKVEICRFGSSVGDPENWFLCTKLSSAGYISKSSPSTVGYTIIAHGSSVEGIAYSLRVRSSAMSYIIFVCFPRSWWWRKRKEEVVEKKKEKILTTKKKLIKLVNSPAAAPKTWWAKPQVYGSAEVVKREYRSNRELFNLIYF